MYYDSPNKRMMKLNDEQNVQLSLLTDYCMNSVAFDRELYDKYDVKRGLRDKNGKGVLSGLTEISDVVAVKNVDGKQIPVDGQLFYQGYNVYDLINGRKGLSFKFEEVTYLLLFGALPTQKQLDSFIDIITDLQELSGQFVRDVLMKASSENIMNALQRSIITLYSYDDAPEDISLKNVLRQSLQLIAKMPLMAVYAYYAYRHFIKDETLLIRNPKKEYSTAENILYMLRPDGKFTAKEAEALDIALVLHADHGGGNNSTFTTHVVTSSGTDTYSAIAAATASLKGPRHGGANLKVLHMFRDIEEHLSDWEDEEELESYLQKILDKEAYDGAGLIYGLGHAVYTLSDPREVLLKKSCRDIAEQKGRLKEFALYENVERIGSRLLAKNRDIYKPICANVDFYSGFIYEMLGIPEELFTPMFAIARISGWSAHRLEEIGNNGKIIRPAYKYVGTHVDYQPIASRKPIFNLNKDA